MPREVIVSEHGPPPSGAYSPIVRAGPFLYVSGQGTTDPASGRITGASVREQVDRTMRNLQLQLEGAGARLDDVVKVQVYLAHIQDFDEFNLVYSSFFSTAPPARTTVGAELGDILVEIDAVAYTG